MKIIYIMKNVLLLGFPPPLLKDKPGGSSKTIKCNCNSIYCHRTNIYNCTSALGCFVTFKTKPHLSAVYNCIEHIPYLTQEGCQFKLTKENTTDIKVVTKCCYEDYCNVEKLIEPYFPKDRK